MADQNKSFSKEEIEQISFFFRELLEKQEPLGYEFEKILANNYWDLLITGEKDERASFYKERF